jgi:hypothetical protein
MTAAANVASLSGSAERSCALLRTALERAPSAKPAEKLWTLTLLAETSARLGKDLEAEEHFKSALALDGRDPYLLGAFSDFLLGQGRAAEVVALLKERTRVDPLLLRLALAEAALSPALPALRDHVNTLQARFESSRLRGDTVHRREQARFTLYLLNRPREALQLAQQNWQVQREPADAHVFLEAALAGGDPAAATPALDFVSTNKLEDVQLQKLTAKFPHPSLSQESRPSPIGWERVSEGRVRVLSGFNSTSVK